MKLYDEIPAWSVDDAMHPLKWSSHKMKDKLYVEHNVPNKQQLINILCPIKFYWYSNI